MSAIELLQLKQDLANQLADADKVISVLMAHLSSGFTMSPKERVERAMEDLKMRGLENHEAERQSLLREVFG